jgi:hypothetical protein
MPQSQVRELIGPMHPTPYLMPLTASSQDRGGGASEQVQTDDLGVVQVDRGMEGVQVTNRSKNSSLRPDKSRPSVTTASRSST